MSIWKWENSSLVFSNETVLPEISFDHKLFMEISFPIDKFQEENFRNKLNFTEN